MEDISFTLSLFSFIGLWVMFFYFLTLHWMVVRHHKFFHWYCNSLQERKQDKQEFLPEDSDDDSFDEYLEPDQR